MKNILMTFLASMLLLASMQAEAGTLSEGLAGLIADMDNQEVIKVLVVMADQPDIRTMDKSLHARQVTLAERHHSVVSTLQETALSSQQDLLRDLDGNKAVGGIVGYVPHWIINAVVVTGTVESIVALADRPDVRIIEPDLQAELIHPVVIKEGPLPRDKDTAGFVTPGIQVINADRVWHELGIDGSGTLVSNMDSGVDGTHPALSGRWRGNWVASSAAWNDIGNVGSPNFPADPYVGHGTHVMGTICGATAFDTVGVAPAAQWIANNAIYGTLENLDNQVIAGFEWIADPDGDPNTTDDVPDVCHNSWGIPAGNGYLPCDSTYWEVIDNCEAAGVVVTFSAGNEGPAPGTLRSPGNRAASPTNCFTVGSTALTTPFLVSSFSSRGPSQCGGEYEIKPEVMAPGESIYSSIPGGSYGYMDGTSMAGPHVAGVVALMRQAAPDLDVTTLKEILMDTAIDMGLPGEDNNYGHGMVDAYAAVTAVMGNVGTISGVVTDLDTGLPLEGVAIRDTRGYSTAITAADGAYEFILLAGETEFEIKLFGYEGQLLPATIPGGGSLPLDASLAPMSPAVVSGIVRGPGGTPVAGATVSALDTPVDPVVSDAAGLYSLTLPSGTVAAYDLLAIAPDLAYSLVQIGLQGARTLDFDLPEIQMDGFESGGFATFDWQRTGPVLWTVEGDQAYEGALSAKTGDIGDSQTTNLEVDYHVQGDGPVSFWYKVDSEIAYDVLEFFIDDILYETWSGNIDWSQYSVDLPTGTHTLRWVYRKDSNTSVGADAAWVDLVEFPGTGVEPVAGASVPTAPLALTLSAGGTGSLPLPITSTGTAYLDYTVTSLVDQNGPLWVYADPDAYSVAPGNVHNQVIAFDTFGLPAGVHNGALMVQTNDPGTPQVIVPVLLTVEGVSSVGADLPRNPTLHGAVPNPFNPMADIKFSLPRQARVTLHVYDVSGRLVRTLVNRTMNSGHHSERWDGRNESGQGVASGVYYARLVVDQETSIKKMALVR